jgi:hypothetical protein
MEWIKAFSFFHSLKVIKVYELPKKEFYELLKQTFYLDFIQEWGSDGISYRDIEQKEKEWISSKLVIHCMILKKYRTIPQHSKI